MLFFNKSSYICIFMLIVVIASFLPVTQMYYQSISWWIRPQAFFLGATIYMLGNKINIKCFYVKILLAFTSIFILLVAPDNFNYKMTLPTIGMAGALLFFCSLSDTEEHKKDNLTYKILDWIGDRSYSIYLCHLPLMHVTREVLNRISLDTAVYENKVIYFFTFILLLSISAELSYRYIEKNFIQIGKSLIRKKQSIL